MQVGDKRKAKDIPQKRNMQLLQEPDDVQWALEQHAQDAEDHGFTVENTDGIIIAGNEDAPIFVWGTRTVDRQADMGANHIDAVYTLLALDE